MSDVAFVDAPRSADRLPFTDAPPAAIEQAATCEQCGGTFEPRKGTGGKPQRFCSPSCRTTFHAANPQRRATYSASGDDKAPEQPAAPTATQRRVTLIAGVEDLDERNPAPTATEAVDTFAPAQAGPDEFNWSGDDVMLPEQRETAIYWNPDGQVVIRQRSDWNEEDDPFVFFSPHNLPAVIAKLQAEYDSWRKP